MTVPTLLPCPFCGAALQHNQGRHDDGICDWWIHTGAECVLAGDIWLAGEQDIERWNRRAPTVPADLKESA